MYPYFHNLSQRQFVGNKLKKKKQFGFQATAEANNLAAVAGAKEVYAQLMEQVCGGAKPYLGAGHLDAEHLRIKDKAVFQVSAISSALLQSHRVYFFYLIFPLLFRSLLQNEKWVAKNFRKNIWNN